jgi:DNA helicase HerA-like ATPase
LNTGTPSAFPRLNGYILLPNEAGATVAYITWIGIERSPYPKRSGLKDFGLIDLPFPLRKMTVSPVGTLTVRREGAETVYQLSRGVTSFPSVGDQVLIPTPAQGEAIVGSRDADRRVSIGSSPTAMNAAIKVDPDKLFGRHLAVLGNTGSGKSCTVAGLIRWSIEAAQKEINDSTQTPNMRFIILDPNGEYSKAFADMPNDVRIFRPGDIHSPFTLPAWMWNSHEWASVTQAQAGAQRPLLLQALRDLRAGRAIREPLSATIVRQVRLYKGLVSKYVNDGSGASYSTFPGTKNCCETFKNIYETMEHLYHQVEIAEPVSGHLNTLVQAARNLYNAHSTVSKGVTYHTAPNLAELSIFAEMFEHIESDLPPIPPGEEISEDAPIPFDLSMIADYIDAASLDATNNPNVSNFIATLNLRIRSMLADRRLAPVIAPQNPPTFENWLKGILGDTSTENGQVAIIDLSIIPSEVTHIIIAVLARIVFEASQRYRKLRSDGKALPTVLVLEEAHTFVRKGADDENPTPTPTRLCREAFERIAREGRKFGLGLVLSSQRPSELSQTVLAQCNTFLLHRLVNDTDQNLVAKLVPDNVGGLLSDLPSLPSRQAILLGWATPIPVLVEINELKESQRPQSDDPDFWDVWTLKKERSVNWSTVATDWSGGTAHSSQEPAAAEPATSPRESRPPGQTNTGQ